MASISDIMTELADLQPSLQEGSLFASDEMKTRLVNEIALKVSRITSIEASQAMRFCATLRSGKLSESHCDILQSAMEKRLSEALDGAAKAAKGRPSTQLLLHNLNYLTANDWVGIEAPNASPETIIDIHVNRYVKCGVRNVAEDTSGPVAATCLYMFLKQHRNWPTYHTIFSWVLLFKQKIRGISTQPRLHQVTFLINCM